MNVDLTWGSGGLFGLLGALALLVFTGKLLAKPTVDRIIKTLVDAYEGRLRDKDERIAALVEANDKLTRANDALLAQSYQSLEIGRTTSSVVRALAAASGGGADGANVGQTTS